MNIYEYDAEKHLRMERDDARTDERNLLFELIGKMTADDLLNDIPRLTKEPAFFDTMVKKYIK